MYFNGGNIHRFIYYYKWYSGNISIVTDWSILVGFECVCKESYVRVARGMLVVSCGAIVLGAAGSLSDMVAMVCYKCGYAYTRARYYNSVNTSINCKESIDMEN